MEDVRNAQEMQTNAADSSIVDSIESKILNIRGRQVMIDRDLAVLYGVETKRLKEQVKRNASRFPDDIMFQLSQYEVDSLRSHFEVNPFICRFYLLLPNVHYNF